VGLHGHEALTLLDLHLAMYAVLPIPGLAGKQPQGPSLYGQRQYAQRVQPVVCQGQQHCRHHCQVRELQREL